MSDPLVTADWLKSNLSAPDVQVIDATWYPGWIARSLSARAEYDKAHVPNAVFFDIDEIADTSSDLPHMLPTPEKFSSRLRRMGIGDGHRVIIYDRNDFMASARVWWTFRVMGHREVLVLDGGFRAWEAAGGEIADLPSPRSDRHHTVRMQPHLVSDLSEVMSASKFRSSQIIDARPTGRFDGRDPEPRSSLRSGHMPGSINLPSSEVHTAGVMKTASELQGLFNARNIDLSRPIIASCGSGVTAAILALAAARLGNDLVSVYDGSWSEWGARDDTPVETRV